VAVALKSSNQNNHEPWAVCKDVTIRNCLIKNAAAPFNFAGRGNANAVAELLNRVLIENVLCEHFNIAPYTGDSRYILFTAGVNNVTLRNVSLYNDGGGQTNLVTIGVGTHDIVIQDCAGTKGNYGVWADGGSQGLTAWNTITGVHDFTTNVIVGSAGGVTYPPGTTFVANRAAAEATGKGVNMTTLNAAIAGVV
jgi:hypothetical protein